ncbi:hypothetical protein [Acetobacter orientalis]|uniref:hypothetical protein n=1 Tax=Acetobacter orientalis TaxID=146474 RepID=UPI000A3D03B1|nr:hypothetical protein [Acetobacter orientalis]
MSRSYTAPLFQPLDPKNGSLTQHFSHYTPSMGAQFAPCCPPHAPIAASPLSGSNTRPQSGFSVSMECDMSHLISHHLAPQGHGAARPQPLAACASGGFTPLKAQQLQRAHSTVPVVSAVRNQTVPHHSVPSSPAPSLPTVVPPPAHPVIPASQQGRTQGGAHGKTPRTPTQVKQSNSKKHEHNSTGVAHAAYKPAALNAPHKQLTPHKPSHITSTPKAAQASPLRTALPKVAQASSPHTATALTGAPQVTDPACHAAARARTSVAQLEHMVALRRSGLSLRQIGRQVGRCMEGVRQALMRYEQAREDTPPQKTTHQHDENWLDDPLREPEPLPPGHPVAMRGLWRGLEHWRGLV